MIIAVLAASMNVVPLCQIDERNQKAIEYVGTRSAAGLALLELLQSEGLQETDHLLEIGCGALSLGIPAMSFLEVGHYVGIDPNPWLIEQTLMIDENRTVVQDRSPRFFYHDDFSGEPTGVVFDYVFAHSIMSHAAYWQLPLFLQKASISLREGGKLIFSLRLTEPNSYGNEGADEETHAEVWQYPGCSFFDRATVIKEAAKWFRQIEYKPHFTAHITAAQSGFCHDWFVVTK